MRSFERGQKMRLSELSSSLQGKAQVRAVAPGLTVDFSCFGVDANGKLSDDRYFIFYNQNSSPEGAVKMGAGLANQSQSFDFDLARLPQSVRRLVFVATIDGEGEMRQLQNGHFLLSLGGMEVARFAFSGRDFASEKAIMAGEIYFKNVWRVAAVGQGFNGGLSALLKHFGGEESEDVSSAGTCTSGASVPNAPTHPPTSAWAGSTAPKNPAFVSATAFPLPEVRRDSIVRPDTCARCGKSIGFVERMRGFNTATHRCKPCDEAVIQAMAGFQRDFVAACSRGTMSPEDWRHMWQRFDPSAQNMPASQALEYVRGDSLQFVERLVTMAAADGIVTEEEESYVALMLSLLQIPAHQQRPFLERIEHLKQAARVREGHLPVVNSSHHLEAGEICHMDTAATYFKQGARTAKPVSGRLLATSKKLHFLSSTGGRTIPYKNIMRVEERAGAVYLELSTQSGHGLYDVADPLLTEATLTALTRISKRQLLEPSSGKPSRHIPQDVRNAVWQRDGGRCVQCGLSGVNAHLEFDHVIPHAKGGANTIGNVQLLCRSCNLKKGDRI